MGESACLGADFSTGRLPEARTLEPYELQGTLWLLHYTTELAREAEIAAAVEVARGDYDPEGAAA